MKPEEIESLYEEFLETNIPFHVDVCTECGEMYTHPIQYCTQCPGATKETQLTQLQYMRAYKKKYKLWNYQIQDFVPYYEENTKTPYPPEYQYPHQGFYTLGNIARKKIESDNP